LEIKESALSQWFTTNRNYHNYLLPAGNQKLFESYHINGKYHRDPCLSPSITRWHKNGQRQYEFYYINGERNNQGPAIIEWDNKGRIYKWCKNKSSFNEHIGSSY